MHDDLFGRSVKRRQDPGLARLLVLGLLIGITLPGIARADGWRFTIGTHGGETTAYVESDNSAGDLFFMTCIPPGAYGSARLGALGFDAGRGNAVVRRLNISAALRFSFRNGSWREFEATLEPDEYYDGWFIEPRGEAWSRFGRHSMEFLDVFASADRLEILHVLFDDYTVAAFDLKGTRQVRESMRARCGI